METRIILLIIVPLGTAFIIPFIDLINAKLRRFFVLLGISIQIFNLTSIVVQYFDQIRDGSLFLQYHLGGWQPPFGINLVMDNLSFLFIAIVTLSLLFIIIYSIGYVGHHEGKFYVLYFIIIAASNGAMLTGDLFNMYVFIELLTIASGALIAFQRSHPGSEAAIKYLFYNIIAGSLIFFGVLLTYFNLGTLTMADVANNFSALESGIQLFITAIFLTALLIKMGVFPFLFWLPKSYDSSPAPVTAVLSGVLSKIYLYLFIRLIWTVIGFETIVALNLNILLIDIALFSSFLGHVFALQANNIKRLLGYSSIGHIGMIFAVIMLNTEAGFYGGILHIIAHMFMKAGLFVACGYLLQYTVSNHYRDFKGVGLRDKPVFIAFIILLLSMIGMPPLLGFASKWFILMAFLEAQSYFGAFIVIFGSLTAVIYYLRYIAKGFEEVRLSEDDLKMEVFNQPLLSVLYREKIVTFITYAYTAVIIIFGFGFRFLNIPLRMSIESIMNVERYIELVLGG
ncbi:MAG: Na+/H+ antiporter subunit D [Halanaerobium sp. MSAO_Bac5]|nr:MAG: Na+/H+ antiporter subunit D [Halanaerobium sp. MSAO_Bac5]